MSDPHDIASTDTEQAAPATGKHDWAVPHDVRGDGEVTGCPPACPANPAHQPPTPTLEPADPARPRPAGEWLDLLGIRVVSPDGWDREARDLTDPVDAATFDRLVANSVVIRGDVAGETITAVMLTTPLHADPPTPVAKCVACDHPAADHTGIAGCITPGCTTPTGRPCRDYTPPAT